MIEIDGSYLEGGGQIVRTALSLSVLFGEPFSVFDIRKGRDKPGLKAQHISAIETFSKLCDASVQGCEIGSTYLKFIPGKFKPKNLSIDIGTAGSITLLLQSLVMPCLFFGKSVKLRIKGGTDVSWSMPYDYYSEILVPHLKKYCETFRVKLLKRGYYPKGGGEVEVFIKPKFNVYNYNNYAEFIEDVSRKCYNINLTEQGTLSLIKGVSHSSVLLSKKNVSERMARGAKHALLDLKVPVKIRKEEQDTLSDGCGITLWAVFSKNNDVDFLNPVRLCADELGAISKKAEDVGKDVSLKLKSLIESKACADEYLTDNLIPWLIFGGKIKSFKISNHTLTNIYTVEKFVGKIFSIDEKENIIFNNT